MSWQAVLITKFAFFVLFSNPECNAVRGGLGRGCRCVSRLARTDGCRRAVFDVWSQGDPSSWQLRSLTVVDLASVFNPLKKNSSGALKNWFGFFFFSWTSVVCLWSTGRSLLNCSVLPQCVRHTQPTLAIHVQQFFFLQHTLDSHFINQHLAS